MTVFPRSSSRCGPGLHGQTDTAAAKDLLNTDEPIVLAGHFYGRTVINHPAADDSDVNGRALHGRSSLPKRGKGLDDLLARLVGAHTKQADASHPVMVSRPDTVTHLIEEADCGTRRPIRSVSIRCR